jgi:hypothetical protein
VSAARALLADNKVNREEWLRSRVVDSYRESTELPFRVNEELPFR